MPYRSRAEGFRTFLDTVKSGPPSGAKMLVNGRRVVRLLSEAGRQSQNAMHIEGLDDSQLDVVIEWLRANGYVKVTSTGTTKTLELTEEGKGLL